MKDAFGSAIRCDSCDTTFPGNTEHDCTVTRAEFDALRADLRAIAVVLYGIGLTVEGAIPVDQRLAIGRVLTRIDDASRK